MLVLDGDEVDDGDGVGVLEREVVEEGVGVLERVVVEEKETVGLFEGVMPEPHARRAGAT